jgi:hypothetical protein
MNATTVNWFLGTRSVRDTVCFATRIGSERVRFPVLDALRPRKPQQTVSDHVQGRYQSINAFARSRSTSCSPRRRPRIVGRGVRRMALPEHGGCQRGKSPIDTPTLIISSSFLVGLSIGFIAAASIECDRCANGSDNYLHRKGPLNCKLVCIAIYRGWRAYGF